MRIVVQRVKSASVKIEHKVKSEINTGLLVLLGIEEADSADDVLWLVPKLINLRIFNDSNNIMNLSLKDISGDIIVVSQFTLYASTKKGNRPSYIKSARPEQAIPLYELFIKETENNLGKKIGTGTFGALMDVSLVNDGPVTIIIDSKNKE